MKSIFCVRGGKNEKRPPESLRRLPRNEDGGILCLSSTRIGPREYPVWSKWNTAQILFLSGWRSESEARQNIAWVVLILLGPPHEHASAGEVVWIRV